MKKGLKLLKKEVIKKLSDRDLTEERKGRGKIGLDKYLVFDEKKGEIRMEIPLHLLLDPKENKKLREEI